MGLADMVGVTAPSFHFRVEEGKVLEFARAVQAAHPLYTDADAARDAGLSGILATPSFSAASAFWTTPEAAITSQLGLDLKRVLAGGGEWEYFAPVVAGDELTVTTSVASVQEKQGSRGPMAVIQLRTEFTRDGELVQTYTNNIIQFGLVAGGSGGEA